MVESWLQQHNINVKESMELEGLEAISSMVMANLGVSIVPKTVQSKNPLPLKRLAQSRCTASLALPIGTVNQNKLLFRLVKRPLMQCRLVNFSLTPALPKQRTLFCLFTKFLTNCITVLAKIWNCTSLGITPFTMPPETAVAHLPMRCGQR